MAKRPNQKPEDTRTETPSVEDVAQAVAGSATAAGQGEVSPVPNTEGAEAAAKPVEVPITAPGTPVQEKSAEGLTGNAEALAGDPPQPETISEEEAQENPSAATAPETPAFADGGLVTGDRAALEAAVAAITGHQMPVIPNGMMIQITPSGHLVKVTGPKKGRRRIGRDFGRDPVLIPIGELTAEDIAALNADPALTVEITSVVITE